MVDINKKELISKGFNRVERDDRLFDVFPKDTAEKGVELWEKWADDTVELIRVHNNQESHHQFSLDEIERALLKDARKTLTLED